MGGTGTLGAHPCILLSQGHCCWGVVGKAVGLLIKLSSVPAPGPGHGESPGTSPWWAGSETFSTTTL